VRYLLDTSVFLWARSAEHKLNAKAQALITSPESELFLSAASSWEISIKYALGSLKLPKRPSEFIPEALRSWSISALDITHEHGLRAGELPPHHRDPFDRMLIAQARSERMVLLTADVILEKYDVDLIDCRP
jgi:PIN domain nuclease of toxin-antitoxin system